MPTSVITDAKSGSICGVYLNAIGLYYHSRTYKTNPWKKYNGSPV